MQFLNHFFLSKCCNLLLTLRQNNIFRDRSFRTAYTVCKVQVICRLCMGLHAKNTTFTNPLKLGIKCTLNTDVKFF